MQRARLSFSHNSLLNFLSQIFAVGISILCVPVILRQLGNEQFGLLSLLWIFLGYFSYLDIGVGQAAVKFLSESVARNERHRASDIVRSVTKLSILLGVASGAAVFLLSKIGFEKVMSVSPPLTRLATDSLQLLALCLPAVFFQSALKSIPTAFQRFDFINLLQLMSGLLQWGGSAVVVSVGGGLFSIVILTVIGRFMLLIPYIWMGLRLLPELREKTSATSSDSYWKLLKYGGWLTVSQLIGPLFSFLERAFIGALLSLSWVTFYAIPSDAALKLLIIPASLITTLFPLMSGAWTSQDGRQQAKSIYQRSTKYTYILVLPVVLILILFGHDILYLWLGEDFASKSTTVLMMLSIGMLFNSLAQFPRSALQALGRPDLPSKLLMIETPFYLALSFALTSQSGIYGTSIAWLLRIVMDSAFLFFLAHRLMSSVPSSLGSSYLWKGMVLGLACALPVFFARFVFVNVTMHLAAMMVFGAIYLMGIWRFVFDDKDKNIVMNIIPRLGKA